MTELELEVKKAKVLVAHSRADFMANQYVLADANAWALVKDEVSRIEAEIKASKEQDNEF